MAGVTETVVLTKEGLRSLIYEQRHVGGGARVREAVL